MIRLKDKKATEMTIGTIVVIILALVVLIFLVFGFSTGWTNIWEKILNFGGGDSNVATVVQACQFACTSQNAYDYCRARNLNFGKDAVTNYGLNATDSTVKKVITNCKNMEGKGIPGMESCSPVVICP